MTMTMNVDHHLQENMMITRGMGQDQKRRSMKRDLNLQEAVTRRSTRRRSSSNLMTKLS